MDYDLLIAELLVALRDSRSQSSLSRELGYSYNSVSRWESGEILITWDNFLKVCFCVGVNIRQTLERTVIYYGPVEDIPAFIECLIEDQSVRAVAQRLGRSRATVKQWLNGNQMPSLRDVLVLISSHVDLFYFVSRIVDLRLLPSFSADLDRFDNTKVSILSLPEHQMVAYFMSLLEFESHQGPSAPYIAKRLKWPQLTVENILKNFVDSGIATAKEEVYELSFDGMIETGGDTTQALLQNLHVKRKWTLEALKVLDKNVAHLERGCSPDDPGYSSSVMGYFSTPISRRGRRKIEDTLAKTLRELRTIAESDPSPQDTIITVNLHLLDVYQSDD